MESQISFKLIELEDASYHLLVPVEFNKKLRADLIIDTGASKSIFDYAILKEFATEIESVSDNLSSGINSFIDSCYLGKVESFSIGSLLIEPFSCILMDLTHVNQLYEKIGQGTVLGLLGSDFLTQYRATISFSHRRLTLRY